MEEADPIEIFYDESDSMLLFFWWLFYFFEASEPLTNNDFLVLKAFVLLPLLIEDYSDLNDDIYESCMELI